MEASRRMMQIMQGAFLMSILVYVLIIKMVPAAGSRNLLMFKILVGVTIALLATIARLRRRLVKPAEETLASQPDDPAALARWRTGYLITYACSEAMALYGVVLHFLGFSLTEVLPFLIAGFVLILFYAPRRPAPAR